MKTNYDVIVIGAGPAGSIAARTLAEKGRSVLLLEKGAYPGRIKACGGMLPYRSFTDFKLDESVIETMMEREIFVFPWFRRETAQPTVTVIRAKFDEHLARLAEAAGADLVMSTRVSNVLRHASGEVEVQATSRREKQTYTARLVIFADGVNSLAYRLAGIGFQKQTANLGLGLEYAFEAPANGLKDYYLFFGMKELTPEWGYVWIFPNKDLYNVGVYLPPEGLHQHPDHDNLLERHIEMADSEFARLLKGKRIVKKVGSYIPVNPAQQFSADSMLAAGDAAGLVFPFTAGGIDPALRSGKLSATVADEALRSGDYSAEFLSQYGQKIKEAPFYRDMQRQFQLLGVSQRLSKLDAQIFPKLFHLYKLKRDLSLINKVRVAAYPLTGAPRNIVPVGGESK